MHYFDFKIDICLGMTCFYVITGMTHGHSYVFLRGMDSQLIDFLKYII